MTSVENVYPLSPLQEGLLFETLLRPDSRSHVMQSSFRLRGSVDDSLLAEAWRRVVRRHPVLRTAFVSRGDGPLQVVMREARLPLALEDWRGFGARERAVRLRALRGRDLAGLDPARPPLMRVALLRLEDDLLQCVWTYHHLVLDGWSRAIVVHDVLLLYGRLVGRPVPDLGPARPYADYLAWLARQDQGRARDFFGELLAGFRAPVELPAPRPSPAGGPAHRTVTAVLPGGVADGLRELAARERLTVSTLVHAAYALVLGRYTGRRDVVFGTVVAGRPPELSGVEHMVGMFANTLLCRGLLTPGLTLREWLARLHDDLTRMREHEYASLADVQRQTSIARGAGLFGSLLAFENYPVRGQAGAAGDVTVEEPGTDEVTSLPLAVYVHVRETVGLRIVHDLTAVAEVAADAMLRDLGHALRSLPDWTGRRLGEVEACDPETLAAAGGLGRGAVLLDPCLPVHELFARRAAADPTAVAISGSGQPVTYGELDAAANRMARALRRVGVEAEAVVGVCLPRSPDLVAVLLAVLEAGGSYLPLEASEPPARLAEMLAQARPAVTITVAGLEGHLPPAAGPVLLLDELAACSAAEPAGALPDRVAPGRRAYVLFTSGSTGRPKGVEVSHGALAAACAALARRPGMDAGDAVLALTTLGFDIAAAELLLPLTVGARIHLYSGDGRDGAEVADAAIAGDVTIVQATPSRWRLLLESGRLPEGIRAWCGGEALPEALSAELRARSGSCWNVYGPTEATIWVAADEVDDHPPGIGGVLDGTELRLLDGDLRLAPPAAVGEVCIAGPQLARGYLGRPDLTAERFVPDPYGPAGSRVYRTGDLAAWRSDGRLAFLGRADWQVKVRGHRVEPGEIEDALVAHPDVQAAAVIAHAAADGGVDLVAWCCGRATPDGLRAWARDRLPAPMVPAAIHVLERLPLLPSGKVDRGALRDRMPAPEAPDGAEPPRGEVEALVAGAWREVLGASGVHRDSDFLLLGGDSLRVMRLRARLERALGVELSLKDLFAATRLRDQAGLIERAPPAAGAGSRQARQLPAGGELPLAPNQRRILAAELAEPGSYNLPSLLLVEGPLDLHAMQEALAAACRRHDALRCSFRTGAGEATQSVAAEVAPEMSRHDLRGAPAEQRLGLARSLAVGDMRLPFRLDRAPLLRCTAYRLDEESHVLALSLSHLVGDGWSRRVLARDLGALYAGLVTGREAVLPTPAQYPPLAAEQAARWTGARAREALERWRSVLGRRVGPLRLRAARPRGPGGTSAAGLHRFRLPEPAFGRLRELALAEGATPFAALLAVYQRLLHEQSGEARLVVGTLTAGRPRLELESAIGCFVNPVAIPGSVDDATDFRTLLRRSRDASVHALDLADVPFAVVASALDPEPAAASPVYQVALALEDLPAPELGERRLRLRGVEFDWPFGRCDLTLRVEPDGRALFEYSTEALDAPDVVRLGEDLVRVLEDAVSESMPPPAAAEEEEVTTW